MTGEAYSVELTLDADATLDPRALDGETRYLRREIERLGAEQSGFVPMSSAPVGTRAVDPIALGALAISVLPPVLPKLFEFLQAWLPNHENRKVRIKVQLGDRSVEAEFPSSMSREGVKSLADDFSKAIAPSAGSGTQSL